MEAPSPAIKIYNPGDFNAFRHREVHSGALDHREALRRLQLGIRMSLIQVVHSLSREEIIYFFLNIQNASKGGDLGHFERRIEPMMVIPAINGSQGKPQHKFDQVVEIDMQSPDIQSLTAQIQRSVYGATLDRTPAASLIAHPEMVAGLMKSLDIDARRVLLLSNMPELSNTEDLMDFFQYFFSHSIHSSHEAEFKSGLPAQVLLATNEALRTFYENYRFRGNGLDPTEIRLLLNDFDPDEIV